MANGRWQMAKRPPLTLPMERMKKLLSSLFMVAALALASGMPAVSRAADYSVTAANVVPSASADLSRGTAGATITAGQAISIDENRLVQLYDADSATATARVFRGIACNGAAAGPIVYCTDDPSFTPGFPVAAGAIVIGSGTAGGLCPAADLATGHYLTIIGVGIGSNKINFSTLAAGVAKP